jgi:hypothetical protein
MRLNTLLLSVIIIALLIIGCGLEPSNSKKSITIVSIGPTNSCNLGPVSITSLLGTNFNGDVTVKLSKDGEDDITASNIVLINSTELTCELDLTGVTTGDWDVVVSSDESNTGKLLAGFTVTNDFYVSTTGNDINTGTASAPKLTIQDAIDAASSGQNIRVAAGSYSISSNISVKQNVSLLGGYDPVTWERDWVTNTTTIEDTRSADTGSSDQPHCVFYVGSTVTPVTIIEGFTINGTSNSPDFSSGIFFDHLSPSYFGANVRHNTINGGNGTSYSYGIYIRGYCDAIIEYNTINGGAGGTSHGFYGRLLDTPIINNNIIHGGSGMVSYGLYFRQGSNIYIYNNIIDGGDGAHSHGVYPYNNSGDIVVIRNNTINGGAGVNNNAYGIRIHLSEPVIENNIIFCSGNNNNYGIYENDDSGEPSAVNNNDIFDCGTALYYDYDTTTNITDIADVNALASASSNISLDPAFEDRPNDDYHLTSSTDNSILTGGLNGTDESWVSFPTNTSGNPIDFDDNERPTATNPWAIGAYEYVP